MGCLMSGPINRNRRSTATNQNSPSDHEDRATSPHQSRRDTGLNGGITPRNDGANSSSAQQGESENSQLRLQAILEPFKDYRMRALAFAAIGIVLNLYGATQGRREWVVKYDGTLYQAAAAKLLKPVVTLSLGFGSPNAILSVVTCLVLMIGVVFGRPLLVLPSLLLSVCELIGDMSDALVAIGLLLAHLGVVPAALYSAVAIVIIAIELFLWHGVLMFYESGIIHRLRNSPPRRFESLEEVSSQRYSKTTQPMRSRTDQNSPTISPVQ